ncbi:MAG: Receiver protein of a two-component response regulator [Bacteroidota bacterium]|jgi:CheY-like chemotaxis protein|nr:Receiver protein of a two-component response regulator [Bacteroidota bacterium]
MIKIKNLWLVDDDEIFVFLTKKTILKTSFEGNVTVFNNGKQALDALVNNKGNDELLPGIIFLDLSMPVMDGWGFLEEFILMKHKFEVPITIYIVSSSVSPHEIERAKGMSEVLDFIIKPVSRERFIEIIKDL